MGNLKAHRVYPLPEGEAVDVLDGFAPGVYRVMLRPQNLVYLGGPDVDAGMNGFQILTDLELVTEPGQCYVIRPQGSGGAGITVLGIPVQS